MEIFDLGMILGLTAAVLFFARQIYWFFLEIDANSKKTKTRTPTLLDYSKRFAANAVTILIIIQLLGFQVVPYENSLWLQLIGFLMVLAGVYVSVAGRRDLGTNWTHASEPQIKKNHELVTRGIYKYIRHPIYSGMILSYVGAELIVGSYLALVFFVVLFIAAYRQAKAEEELLIRQFGKKYLEYMNTSKMFLPRML